MYVCICVGMFMEKYNIIRISEQRDLQQKVILLSYPKVKGKILSHNSSSSFSTL